METTQTGMPVIDCQDCGGRHPVGRRHCADCGRPSLFISPAGNCLECPTTAAAADLRRGDSLSLRGGHGSTLLTALDVKRAGDVVTVRTRTGDLQFQAGETLVWWRD